MDFNESFNSYTTLQDGKAKPQMPGAGFKHHKHA